MNIYKCDYPYDDMNDECDVDAKYKIIPKDDYFPGADLCQSHLEQVISDYPEFAKSIHLLRHNVSIEDSPNIKKEIYSSLVIK